MGGNRFIEVYWPSGPIEIAQAKLALEGAGIPFYINNENYMAATGMPYALGVMRVAVMVPEGRVAEAVELLRDWFGGGAAEE
jgi:hypothetical protein